VAAKTACHELKLAPSKPTALQQRLLPAQRGGGDGLEHWQQLRPARSALPRAVLTIVTIVTIITIITVVMLKTLQPTSFVDF